MLKTLIAAPVAMLTITMTGPSAYMVEKPPVEFQRPPEGPATVFYADPQSVDAVCRQLAGLRGPTGYVILACTVPGNRRQLMPDPCLYPEEYFASLQCHENAHLPRADGTRWSH